MKTSYFTPEIWATIIEKTEEGEHLRGICREIGIGKSAVYDWMANDPELKASYETARKEGYDKIAEDCLDIADDKTEEPASRKVRVHTRLQLLSKWYGQRYGDKQQIEHTGAEGGPIQVTRIERVVLDPK